MLTFCPSLVTGVSAEGTFGDLLESSYFFLCKNTNTCKHVVQNKFKHASWKMFKL